MCSCVADGLPMYIAYYGMYMLKRMPDTGPQHHPSCDSFEPEAGLSGRGDLGASIQVDAEQRIHVTTNFSLSKRSRLSEPSLAEPQAPAASQGLPAPSPRTPKCSLAGLLHLLWDEAGFNRWHPKMQGKRWQATLHKYLTQEAQRVEVNGIPLAERLYVPEPWRVADKDAIAERRRQHLAFAARVRAHLAANGLPGPAPRKPGDDGVPPTAGARLAITADGDDARRCLRRRCVRWSGSGSASTTAFDRSCARQVRTGRKSSALTS